MAKKIKVAILCGGKSSEHEVSLMSAKNIVNAIDKNKYEVTVIGISNSGNWLQLPKTNYLLNSDNPKTIALSALNKSEIISASEITQSKNFDVVFPVLHGTYGEDGSMQGFLKVLNIPFVGPSVLGSAVCMDKEITKRVLKSENIPVARFLTYLKSDINKIDFSFIKQKLGLPVFVKPANNGSSVGINKVKTLNKFKKAISEAFRYDNKIIIEENINGREIECSVLGNENAIASLPGEVIPNDEFYSYKAKYIDENGARLNIPAKITKNKTKKIQELAVKSFKLLGCEGMARIDFFLLKNGKIIVNEVNTIPGFTSISMYPKLWQASGISYTELIDRLIKLAIARYTRDSKLRTTVN